MTDKLCLQPKRLPVQENFSSPSVEADKGWLLHLQEHGWVIIPRDSQLWEKPLPYQAWLQEIQEWIVAYGRLGNAGFGVNVAGYQAWEQQDIPGSDETGYVRHNAGHTSFMWDARLWARAIFQKVWNNQELLTSFEGFTYAVPKDYQCIDSLQFDHPPQEGERIGVRGLLSLTDTHSGEICLATSSHLEFLKYTAYARTVEESSKQRFHVPLNYWKDQQDKIIRLHLRAGDMLLFDTRLAYRTNSPSIEQDNHEPWAAMWISMMPALALAYFQDTGKRVRFFKENVQTGPWCYGPLLRALPQWASLAPFGDKLSRDQRGLLQTSGGLPIAHTQYGDIHATLVANLSLTQVDELYQKEKANPTTRNDQSKKEGKSKSRRHRSFRRPSKDKK